MMERRRLFALPVRRALPARRALSVPPAALAMLAALALTAASARAQRPLTLQQSIDLAQRQGLQARAAESSRDAARRRDRAFTARRLPQLSLTGDLPVYNRSIIEVLQPDGSTEFRAQRQTNAALNLQMSQRLPVTGGSFFISSALSRLEVNGERDIRNYSSTPLSVGIRQDILRPNAFKWDGREQDLRSEAAERQYLEAREDVAIAVTQSFFDLYTARLDLQNATRNAAVNDTLYTLNKGRFEVGTIGENDLLQSELALLRSRNALDAARLEQQRAAAALRLLLNLGPAEPFAIAASTTVPQFQPDTLVAVTEARRNRALGSEAELQEVQSRRRLAEARLNNGLGATVQASYGFNATGTDARAAYSNLLEARQFTLSVEVPLLQWGLRKESIQAARADQDRVRSESRAALDAAAQEAHFAVLELLQARSTLALSAKADTVAGRRFDVAYNRYVIGRIDIDNLYFAQGEKDQAVAQFVQALRGYWVAYYRLRRVTLFDFETGQPLR